MATAHSLGSASTLGLWLFTALSCGSPSDAAASRQRSADSIARAAAAESARVAAAAQSARREEQRADLAQWFDGLRFGNNVLFVPGPSQCNEDLLEAIPGHYLALADARVLSLEPLPGPGDSVAVRTEVVTVAEMKPRGQYPAARIHVRTRTDTMRWTIRPTKPGGNPGKWEVCSPGYSYMREIEEYLQFLRVTDTADFNRWELTWEPSGSTWSTLVALADSVRAHR